MAIPEKQLETWSHQGAGPGSRDTYATVKRALEAPDTKYVGRKFEVFLQGSYGNDTNIYGESDVDVVIRMDDVYYYEIGSLDAEGESRFRAQFIPRSFSISLRPPPFSMAAISRTNNSCKLSSISSGRSQASNFTITRPPRSSDASPNA